MAEQMLVLMVDLDREAQARLSGWYEALRQAGFTGAQTPGLPYHISLAVFPPEQYPWTPHTTILIDEPEVVQAALPVLIRSFKPFVARITGLHLCAFWPTREVAACELTGENSAENG